MHIFLRKLAYLVSEVTHDALYSLGAVDELGSTWGAIEGEMNVWLHWHPSGRLTYGYTLLSEGHGWIPTGQ